MKITLDASSMSGAFTLLERQQSRLLRRVIEEATSELKADLRADVVASGLGQKLANTWRSTVYPFGAADSMDPAGWVYSKAPKLIYAFEAGVSIRSKEGRFLAIPTAAAGQRGKADPNARPGDPRGNRRQKVTPGGWERLTGLRLYYVYVNSKISYLITHSARLNSKGLAKANRARARGGGLKQPNQSVVIFILLRQVRMPKRLDVKTIAASAARDLNERLIRAWK